MHDRPPRQARSRSSPAPARASARRPSSCSAAKARRVVGADLHGADFECDAGDEEQVEALVDHTVRDHGGLDIFFANAGISGGFASIFEQDAEDWAEILRVNLIGPFLAIKYAAPAMKERGGGSIICHRLGRGPSLGRGRAGLFGVQGGRDQPGQGRRDPAGRRQHPRQRHLPRPDRDRHDRARSTSAPGPRGRRSQIGHLNPLKRGGAPIEIANAALFLASDECELCQRAGASSSTAAFSHPTPSTTKATDGPRHDEFAVLQARQRASVGIMHALTRSMRPFPSPWYVRRR